MDQRAHFLELVSANPVNAAILERGPALGVTDWWLTAGERAAVAERAPT